MFSSFQGEGVYNGKPTYFIRFFGCNLKCDGFGQKNPTHKEEYVLPYKTINIDNIKTLDDLPVFETGCDSSYSWYSKYKKFIKKLTYYEIFKKIQNDVLNDFNTDICDTETNDNVIIPGWYNTKTGNDIQLCFTGGEPLLFQKQINGICEILNENESNPPLITIETNATQKINKLNICQYTDNLHFSCSPKLYNVTGEENVIKEDIIKQYIDKANSGCIKFVHNGTKNTWLEIDEVMNKLKFLTNTPNWSIWIMPVNSTIETQTPEHLQPIIMESLKRGFNVSMRSHIIVFGNKIGK